MTIELLLPCVAECGGAPSMAALSGPAAPPEAAAPCAAAAAAARWLGGSVARCARTVTAPTGCATTCPCTWCPLMFSKFEGVHDTKLCKGVCWCCCPTIAEVVSDVPTTGPTDQATASAWVAGNAAVVDRSVGACPDFCSGSDTEETCFGCDAPG